MLMDSSTSVRFIGVFAVLLFFAACSTANTAPQTRTSSRTSFEPGVQPPSEGADPATAPATASVSPEGTAGQPAANAAVTPSTATEAGSQVATAPPATSSVPAPAAAAPPPMETPMNLTQVDPVPGSTREQDAVARLQKRVDELASQVSVLTEKLSTSQSAKRVAAVPHPAEDIGDDIEPAPVKRDPESGFVNDAPVRAYRQAMILYLSRKYSEAVLAFSDFLQNHADHPLAGSAQFYVGECYFQQKEYRLAAQEYSRVLTAYERSAQVTQALRKLASAQDQLQQAEEAARTRQTLSSLFPQSPAAEPGYAVAASNPPPSAGTAAPEAKAETSPEVAASAGLAPGGEPTETAPSLAPQEIQGEKSAAPTAPAEATAPGAAKSDAQEP
jgi:tol-pal system protein YbgF